MSSSSCNFLDEEAYEFITPDNFYKTEADANAALTAVYNTFADEKSYRRYIWMGADFPGEAPSSAITRRVKDSGNIETIF